MKALNDDSDSDSNNGKYFDIDAVNSELDGEDEEVDASVTASAVSAITSTASNINRAVASLSQASVSQAAVPSITCTGPANEDAFA